jgi:dienelactone hydrolase
MRRCLIAGLLALGACAATLPSPESTAALGEQVTGIPVPGSEATITARLCRPAQPGPAPLVLINHGSPVRAEDRATMVAAACTAEAVRWFTERGFAVGLPLRRGYGASGGAWAEGYGRCGDPDFVMAGRASAVDIAAAMAHIRRLPDIREQGVVVVGQSAGGWGALALAGENPPGVAAVLNMAGGRGGWAQGAPNTNCGPERLVAAAGEFGRTARLPTLWVYTANDSFFAPELAGRMYRAFAFGGGSAEFVALGPWGRDGHGLFFGQGGSATWGPPVEAFLRLHGYSRRPG